MAFRVGEKRVCCTGGAAGVGRTTVLEFVAQDARVAILDIQKEAGEELAQRIRDGGGEAIFTETVVTDAGQVDRAFDEIAATFGPCNVLLNHARAIIVKPLHESTEEDYDRLMDINVRSAFLVCRGGRK